VIYFDSKLLNLRGITVYELTIIHLLCQREWVSSLRRGFDHIRVCIRTASTIQIIVCKRGGSLNFILRCVKYDDNFVDVLATGEQFFIAN